MTTLLLRSAPTLVAYLHTFCLPNNVQYILVVLFIIKYTINARRGVFYIAYIVHHSQSTICKTYLSRNHMYIAVESSAHFGHHFSHFTSTNQQRHIWKSTSPQWNIHLEPEKIHNINQKIIFRFRLWPVSLEKWLKNVNINSSMAGYPSPTRDWNPWWTSVPSSWTRPSRDSTERLLQKVWLVKAKRKSPA